MPFKVCQTLNIVFYFFFFKSLNLYQVLKLHGPIFFLNLVLCFTLKIVSDNTSLQFRLNRSGITPFLDHKSSNTFEFVDLWFDVHYKVIFKISQLLCLSV